MKWPIHFYLDANGVSAGDRGPLLPASARARLLFGVGCLALFALLVVGWKLFWFLTDDAYIAFRYVSNSHLGHGYTWNPPPFRPVEGYTSFAWVVLLDLIWRLFKIAPPVAANPVALLFAASALALTGVMALRLRWGRELAKAKYLLTALALVGIVTNRTFLAWASSGLETALFTFGFVLWIWAVVFVLPRRRGWLVRVCAAASLVYLTRPDGILLVLGSLLLAWLGWRRGVLARADLLGATPLVVVPAHFLWRRFTYGTWLPNAYYAKKGFWPESGLQYAVSFLLEYGLWIWLLVAAVCLVRRRGAALGGDRTRREDGRLWIPATTAVVLAVLAIHFGYYSFVIGGDHFEYRVYNHLVPLLWLGFLWLLNAAQWRARVAAAVILFALVVSWPLPWTHWAKTRGLSTRTETFVLIEPVADDLPLLVRPYARLFDAVQSKLIDHSVCMRHQEHKVFHQTQLATFPARAEGARIGWKPEMPIVCLRTVGVPGWTLPHVAIIDLFGLNDFVIARNVRSGRETTDRRMGHNRFPPPGYLDCFAPNVELTKEAGLAVKPRPQPMTDQDIETCERRWWDWAEQ